MQPFTIIAAAAAIALAATVDEPWNASRILLLVGLLGAVIQAVLSRFWVVPLSEDIIGWEEHGTPADHRPFVRQWEILHGGRVFGGVLAFVCFLLSLLLS